MRFGASILRVLGIAALGLMRGSLLGQAQNLPAVAEVQLNIQLPLKVMAEDSLRELIDIRAGEPYSPLKIRLAIKRLFGTGAFEDVRVNARRETTGTVLTFELTQRLLVRSVSFEGNTEMGRDKLERTFAVREGDRFNPDELRKGEARLKEFYRRNGYLLAQVQAQHLVGSELPEARLRVRMEAGPKTKIRRLAIHSPPILEAGDLYQILRSSSGGNFNEIALEDDIHRLEWRLATLGYFQAQVKLGQKEFLPALNAMDVAFQVEPGPRVDVVIEGATLGAEVVHEILPMYQERNLEQVFLSEGRLNLREHLEKKGHFMARVSYDLRSGSEVPRSVVYRVQPGPRLELHRIEFDGNATFPAEVLSPLLGLQTRSLFSRGNFTTRILERDEKGIANYYRAQGFLEAKVYAEKKTDGNELMVIFHVEEGLRYRVRKFRVDAPPEIDAVAFLSNLKLREGDPLSYSAIADDRSFLITRLTDGGYKDVRVRSEVQLPQPGHADVTYLIQPGRQYFVEDVVVTGNLVTRRPVIEREIMFRSGEPYDFSAMLQTEQNLYNLNLFNKVDIRTLPDHVDEDHLVSVIDVRESKRYTFNYGFGYAQEEGPRGTIELTDSNLGGTHRVLGTRLRVGAREQRFQMNFTEPRFFGFRQPFNTTFLSAHENRESFNVLRNLILLQMEKSLSRSTSLLFRYGFQDNRLRDLRASLEELARGGDLERRDRPIRLSSFSFSVLQEKRDDPLNPTRGEFRSFDLLVTSPAFGSNEQFASLFVQEQFFRRLVGDWVLGTSLRVGLKQPFGNFKTVPISERFFAGGSNSLRGFNFEKAGPVELVERKKKEKTVQEVVPLGGNALVIGNVELRHPLYRSLSAVLFYDGGNVFRRISDIHPRDFTHNFGFGFRFQTPLGPVRLEFGWNTDRPPFLDNRQWFLTIGPPF